MPEPIEIPILSAFDSLISRPESSMAITLAPIP